MFSSGIVLFVLSKTKLAVTLLTRILSVTLTVMLTLSSWLNTVPFSALPLKVRLRIVGGMLSCPTKKIISVSLKLFTVSFAMNLIV